MLNSSELQKRLYDSIRSNKCTNKGCLSNGEDNLEVAWFGKQYDEKCLTCSSCYIMNDEAVRKSIPTAFNVLPLSAFLAKFASEAKVYEEKKLSPKWPSTDLALRTREHLAQMNAFEAKLVGTLKALAVALQKFSERAIQANSEIFNQQIFNEIIRMYSDDKMEKVLERIHELIKFLNMGEDGKYRFYSLEARTKKVGKLAAKVDEVTQKVMKTLDELLAQIQEKTANIAKI